MDRDPRRLAGAGGGALQLEAPGLGELLEDLPGVVAADPPVLGELAIGDEQGAVADLVRAAVEVEHGPLREGTAHGRDGRMGDGHEAAHAAFRAADAAMETRSSANGAGVSAASRLPMSSMPCFLRSSADRETPGPLQM